LTFNKRRVSLGCVKFGHLMLLAVFWPVWMLAGMLGFWARVLGLDDLAAWLGTKWRDKAAVPPPPPPRAAAQPAPASKGYDPVLDFKEGMTVVKCVSCERKLRVPTGRRIRLCCPACRAAWTDYFIE
jgi:hypothetical protein